MTRRLAMAALVTGNQATASVIERGLHDADVEVRRFAATGLATDARIDERDRILLIAFADKEPRVRLEAIRAWGRQLQKTSCAPIRAALKDADPHVQLQAIDQLGTACPAAESAASDLAAIVATLNNTPRTWHAPAHAIVSLARIQPDAARQALPRFVQHQTWQVRMYAAHAAATLAAMDALNALSTDPNDNVREAVLSALIDRGQGARGQVERRKGDGAADHRAWTSDEGTQGHHSRSAHGDPQPPAVVRRCVASGEPRRLLEGFRSGDCAEGGGDADDVDRAAANRRSAAAHSARRHDRRRESFARQVVAFSHGGCRQFRHRTGR
jgi:hypothetical protein